MAKCGNCGQEGQTVEHVKECYAGKHAALATAEVPVKGFAKAYVEAQSDYKPMALAPHVPASDYAIKDELGLAFYRVKYGKKGTKWEHFAFVSRLIGNPGTELISSPIKNPSNRKAILNLLSQDALSAAKLFSATFQKCCVCGAALSDEASLERGMGPICAQRFGA